VPESCPRAAAKRRTGGNASATRRLETTTLRAIAICETLRAFTGRGVGRALIGSLELAPTRRPRWEPGRLSRPRPASAPLLLMEGWPGDQPPSSVAPVLRARSAPRPHACSACGETHDMCLAHRKSDGRSCGGQPPTARTCVGCTAVTLELVRKPLPAAPRGVQLLEVLSCRAPKPRSLP
jgi:hypothetical protein